MKQNQHLFRPFPGENPEVKQHDELYQCSKCHCSPCQKSRQQPKKEIFYDNDLQQLKNTKERSIFVWFLNQIQIHSVKAMPNFNILDTIVFSPQGQVRYVILNEHNRLRITKLPLPLKNFIKQRKYRCDLDYQKKKYQREHEGFSFTQLDHKSEKLIKQFETNIKFTNPRHNRVIICKQRDNEELQILSQFEANSMFTRVARRMHDFTKTEYIQIFPIMYGEEEFSYVTKVKYFREREVMSRNYKMAELFVSNWLHRNETMEQEEDKYLEVLREEGDEQKLLMYHTCKLFIYYQQVADQIVETSLLEYITNDKGCSFALKNIETLTYLSLTRLHQMRQQLPKKLVKGSEHIDLRQQMRVVFDGFQAKYDKLEYEKNQMEEKLMKDIELSNEVYRSLGSRVLSPMENKQSFINSIYTDQFDSGQRKIELIDSIVSEDLL